MQIVRDFFRILKEGGAPVWKTILVLLLLDGLIIGMYVFYGMQQLLFDAGEMPHIWRISEDFSASEIFNYLKWLAICGLLAIVFMRTRIVLFAAFSFVFLLVLLDDMLQLHERGGAILVDDLGLSSFLGLRAQDYGELLVWGMLGLCALAALIIGFLNSPAHSRPFGSYFLVILCGLVATAMGLDMVNVVVGAGEASLFNKVMTGFITIAEDGGEMIVGSFGCGGGVAVLMAGSKHYNLK